MKNKIKVWCIILFFLVFIFLTGCHKNTPQEIISEEIGVDCTAGEVVVYERDYGGFPIDGTEYGELCFSDNELEEFISQNNRWKGFPLSENLATIAYGHEKHYADDFVLIRPPVFVDDSDPLSYRKPRIPPIEHGYYYFEDKLSAEEGKNQWDDSLVFSRGASRNYTFAIYDADTQMLYFGKNRN
jgi:hypothetical protein